MLSSLEKVIFAVIIILTFFFFIYPVYDRFLIIRSGLPEQRFDRPLRRLWQALTKILFQRCTLKKERILTGFMHVFIFYGALTFDLVTVNHTLEGFFPDFFIFDRIGLGSLFSLAVNVLALLVLAATLFFIIKRFIFRPKAYATTRLDSGIIYFFLFAVSLSYLYFECSSILHGAETRQLAFLGNFLAKGVEEAGLSPESLLLHFKLSWWLHILLVYAFIIYIPHSKYFHIFAGSINLIFSSNRPLGYIKNLDLEALEIYGVEKSTDYTWKDLLDCFACMECGRCQDACPAFASNKPLSPKMIIFNLKKHLLASRKALKQRKREELKSLIDGVYTPDEIWTCTTCGACMQVCPVEIEHIPKIIGVRQSQVLMESRFPGELNAFFRNLETNSNPWGLGFAERAKWACEEKARLLSEHPEARYLFWLGCSGSFDDRGKRIASSMLKILHRAEMDFALLGPEEKCCGDSAKRLGNEYLFQTLAQENIEMFKKYKVKKILAICPHCYHIFKNEYPFLIDRLPHLSAEEKKGLKEIEIIHHTQLISSLLKEGRIALKNRAGGRLTFHDACYLARHNGVISEPREILLHLNKGKYFELKNRREHGFCCGAGGGLMWTEETLGVRINHLRIDEILSSGAQIAATSCPYCLTMLEDGIKDRGKAEEVKVKDLAQLVAEDLE